MYSAHVIQTTFIIIFFYGVFLIVELGQDIIQKSTFCVPLKKEM